MIRQGDIQAAVARAIGDGCLFTDEIVTALAPKPRKQVNQAIGRMVIGGVLERIERGCFRLTAEGKRKLQSGERFRPGPRGPLAKPRGPRRASLRQRAWNAMRIKRRFTVEDIVTLAARQGERSPRNNLHRYLSTLLCAGYLSRRGERSMEGQAPSSNGLIVYRLEKNTGPIAPSVAQDRKSIFDHNIEERVSWEA